ncbi:tol-pal system YbgF family protein [Planctomycetota bacterium]
MKRMLILAMTVVMLCWLAASGSVAAGKKPSLRWSKSWGWALEEAWMRNCPIIVHLHDEAKNASKLIYRYYKEPAVIKRSRRAVNVPIITIGKDHPFEKQKDDKGKVIEISKTFTGLAKSELTTLVDKREENKFLGDNPGDRPAFMCFRHDGTQENLIKGEISIAQLVKFYDDAAKVVSSTKIIPLEIYLAFSGERSLFLDRINEGEWFKALAVVAKLRTTYVKYERFLVKIEDLADLINVKGFEQVDLAMDLEDITERKKALKKVISDFPNTPAAERAAKLLRR